ncbi:hypothetical protein RHSIM_Rhsim04G0164600 [Rhododendron simsii]|uniref:Uncharacterized protein n=1 Tax=Rhododendron simsii TaxID=118357 RepID=A0A834H4C3_RHOSS|nr:hypothetical protein RHSIM_Rhsim04G0164600 [Rhododendron simsii]
MGDDGMTISFHCPHGFDRPRAGLRRVAHILLGYTPLYTGGLNLRPEPRTQHPFPVPELPADQNAGPSSPINRRHPHHQPAVITVAAQQGEIELPEGIP